MRRIRKILDEHTRLKGEYAALTRCVSKGAISNWRRRIEVMNEVQISELKHVGPSHAEEVGRRTPRAEWATWLDKCERGRWTVAELRERLRNNGRGEVVPRGRVADAYLKSNRQFVAAIKRAIQMASRVRQVRKLVKNWHDEVRQALTELEQLLSCDAQ